MPRAVHERLIYQVSRDLERKLEVLPSRADPAAQFAENIEFGGSPTIAFDDPQYGQHCPDASFGHADAKYPGVVIEVSYSQKKDLARLADDYILGSDGRIHVVVGLDLDYRGRSASVSIWRARTEVNAAGEEESFVHQTLSDEVFYDR